MFILGREKAKDEFDILLGEGKSFMEARAIIRERERQRRERATQDSVERLAKSFSTSSAGLSKEAMFLSNRGAPLALSSIKTLSAVSLQRLPEARQPLSLVDRPLTDAELVDVAVRRALLTGSLDLKCCNMTILPPNATSNLYVQFGNLTAINLNSNQLSTLPASFAPLCPRLTELSVSNNRLRDVPQSILYLPRVTELNLSYNRIEEVDVLQAPEMQVLRLSNNYVSSLDNMSYLRKLHTLHLSYCHMSQLTAHMKKLKSLTYLDLSHNTLVSLALPSRDAAVSKSAMKEDGDGEEPTAVQASAAAVGDKRVWEEVMDPFTGRKSYFCKQTREARRTKPPGFDEQQAKMRERTRVQREAQLAQAEKLGLGPEAVPESVAALGDGRVATPLHSAMALLKPQAPEDPWQEFLDEASGYPYFVNVLTGETAWEKPARGRPKVALKGWELTVDVTSSDGAVYYRNLATNITQWDMPEEMDTFDALENLTELNLAHNRLTEIASSVFKLPRLTDLNAEYNLIKTLPTTVSQATSLTRLNLSFNSLEGLPKELYFMHWLKRLTVDNNRLTELTEDLGVMQGLEVLWIGMNMIERLPFTFGKLKNLTDVMLLSNPFKFPSPEDIAKGIDHVRWRCRQEGYEYFRGPPPAVRFFRTGIAEEGCMFESEFLKTLTLKLKEAEKTHFINLNFTSMPKLPRTVWEPLWKVTTIQDLRLVDAGLKKLPIPFLNFTCLTNLVLRKNHLSELPDHLDLFPNLTGLHIEANVLTGLPPTFRFLTNLKELVLASNRIEEIPDSLCKMTKLRRLVLDMNCLSRLPSRIGNLGELKYLCCARNQITHLPESIVHLTKLKVLIVYQNRLGDRGVPDTICDMVRLKELQLSFNNISRLPYRFTSGSTIKTLRKLWLYGNCFFDIGDLALRMTGIRDFRIDNCPLKSPPAYLTADHIPGLVRYTTERITRIRELQRRCEAEGWVVDPTRFVPTAARDGHVLLGGYGTLNEAELSRFDDFVESYVNGDIAKCEETAEDVVDELVAIHRRRWFKHVRRVVMEFQEFLRFIYFNNLISDEYFCTSLMRPWGRDGEDVECYGIDLDALYVNTGFRVAVLDIFRGPARLKLPSVTRFAGPEEFKPKKRTRGLLGFFGGGGGSSSDDDEGVSTAPELHTAYGDKKAEWNPQGNWLWQLATELVPVERDDTDVLNSEIPPPFNRHRNPKCHPHAGAGADADGDGSIPVPPSILDMVKGAVPSDDGGAAAVEAAAETTEINEKRLKVGLPPLPNPNSAAEQEKRLRARKTAVHLNTQVRFNVPRHELEQILREFEGPFGPVASPNEPVPFPDCPHPKYEAYANGLPVPDFINPDTQAEAEAEGKGKKRQRRKKKKKKKKLLPGEENDRSDSEAEEERVEKFWEGKHRPCVRKAWVVAKWTLTKKEARRQEAEEHEVYELAVRLREMIDEHLHTAEGLDRLHAEVDRRMAHAKEVLDKAELQLAETQTTLVDVRKQQLALQERARRFRAGWDFEEHGFRSEHEVDKALRRAQLEINDWEAFVDTAQARVQRKSARASMTRDQWEMNAVRSLQKVQDKLAKDMIFEKNRRIALNMGWRRPWDGRGGEYYLKWKAKKELELLYTTYNNLLLGEVMADEDMGAAAAGEPPSRKALRKPHIAAYDVVSAVSDPRTRNFPFAPDTDSEDEQDKQERENLEMSSEEEFVPDDHEAVVGVFPEDGATHASSGTDDERTEASGEADEEDDSSER